MQFRDDPVKRCVLDNACLRHMLVTVSSTFCRVATQIPASVQEEVVQSSSSYDLCHKRGLCIKVSNLSHGKQARASGASMLQQILTPSRCLIHTPGRSIVDRGDLTHDRWSRLMQMDIAAAEGKNVEWAIPHWIHDLAPATLSNLAACFEVLLSALPITRWHQKSVQAELPANHSFSLLLPLDIRSPNTGEKHVTSCNCVTAGLPRGRANELEGELPWIPLKHGANGRTKSAQTPL